MLSLTDDGQTYVQWKGQRYKLDLAFDRVLLFLDLIEDKQINESDKYIQAISIFLGKKGETIEQTFERLPKDAYFFRAIFDEINKQITEEPYGQYSDDIDDTVTEKVFDYHKDAGAIYAAFWETYSIDLHKQIGKLQWNEFKALFDGLSSKTYFKRILEIRQKEIDSDMSSKEKSDIQDAQTYFALNDPRIKQMKHNQSMFASLAGLGGK